jgi:hypothetical protein
MEKKLKKRKEKLLKKFITYHQDPLNTITLIGIIDKNKIDK